MTCNNRLSNPDDRFLAQQENRKISRLWKSAINKQSPQNLQVNFSSGTPNNYNENENTSARNAVFDPCGGNSYEAESGKKSSSPTSIQKKLAKGKSIAKIKSPLQKFDEIVTKELTNRRMNEEEGIPPFEGAKKWSCSQFSGSKFSDLGRSKISVENKISRGALHSVEKEVNVGDPSDVQNATLMEAIDKLAQAQAFCRFDAAVKAAEAATAAVPLEMAEEVAVACTKDYQSEIVDVINEKIPLTEEKKPVEVIGYIGVTKLKDNI